MRFTFTSLCLAAAVLTGCVYKIDIQQGNVVIAEQLAKDYYFYNEKKGKEVERNKITIHFADDKVTRIDGAAPVAIKGEERK